MVYFPTTCRFLKKNIRIGSDENPPFLDFLLHGEYPSDAKGDSSHERKFNVSHENHKK